MAHFFKKSISFSLVNLTLCLHLYRTVVQRHEVLQVPELARSLDEDAETVWTLDALIGVGSRVQLLAHLPRQEGNGQGAHLGAE